MPNQPADLDLIESELHQEYAAKLDRVAAAKQSVLDEQKNLELMTEKAQERRSREIEQSTAQEQFEQYTALMKERINALAGQIRQQRDEYQAALDLVASAGRFQQNAVDQMALLLREFASNAGHYRAMADNDPEFQRVLLNTAANVTLGLEESWRLRIDPQINPRVVSDLKIFNPGWTGHIVGDRRNAAMREGLKKPSAQAPHLDPADRRNGEVKER